MKRRYKVLLVLGIIISIFGTAHYVKTQKDINKIHKHVMSEKLSDRMVHYLKYKNVYRSDLTFHEFYNKFYTDTTILKEYETHFGIK